MKPIVRFQKDYRWEGIPLKAYKPEGDHFRDVTRQVLFGADSGLTAELRYFEIQEEGHSTLEKHAHSHAVMVLRGEGRVLVGTEVFDVRPFDIVRVPPLTWHQFRSSSAAPLGFLCLVNAERDRPIRPTEEELRQLRSRKEVDDFIRA
jgi:mannose-6-phosphate isomerase-like protein (cupin superfamily)